MEKKINEVLKEIDDERSSVTESDKKSFSHIIQNTKFVNIITVWRKCEDERKSKRNTKITANQIYLTELKRE